MTPDSVSVPAPILISEPPVPAGPHPHEKGEAPSLIVPFTSDVQGLTISVVDRRSPREAYECRGRLVPLGMFNDIEFFVCPLDYSWTMVYTHEDYEWGGPYFMRREWIS